MGRLCLKTILAASLALALVLMLASVSIAADIERRTLELKLGGSDVVSTAFPVKRVSIADNSIADIVVLSPKELYVFGKNIGYTSVILWEGTNKTLLDIVVALDLTGLKEQLHRLYSDQDIEVYGSDKGVVLSGTVSGPEIVEQVIRLTKNFLPKQAEDKAAEGTGHSGPGITNLLKVGGIQQVMLEVKVAEIARSEWYREGRVPLHTLRADIDYGFAEALTTYGIIGIKVWIFKGEIFDAVAQAESKETKN